MDKLLLLDLYVVVLNVRTTNVLFGNLFGVFYFVYCVGLAVL